MRDESGLEISLEADTENQTMPDFLNSLTAQIDFKDITVRELPMDMIITKIYSE